MTYAIRAEGPAKRFRETGAPAGVDPAARTGSGVRSAGDTGLPGGGPTPTAAPAVGPTYPAGPVRRWPVGPCAPHPLRGALVASPTPLSVIGVPPRHRPSGRRRDPRGRQRAGSAARART